MFYKKGVLKIFLKIRKTPKNSYKNLNLNKVSGLLWHRCFLVNFAKFLRTPFQWNSSIELLSNVTKLKEKKKQTHAIQKWIGNKAKYQLETTLINSNIKGRKIVNVKGKDLVSWVAKKQSLTKEFVFCTNCCFLLKYFFVKIQQNWELIILFVRNYNLN